MTRARPETRHRAEPPRGGRRGCRWLTAAGVGLGLSLFAAHAARATTVVATIPVGSFPHGVAVNPVTNRIYVTNSGGQGSGYPGNTVSVIDGATNTVLTTVTVGTGAFGVAVNPTTNRIYVSNRSDDTVSVIDGVTNTLIGSPIVVGNQPEEIQVNPGNGRVYVANWNGSGAASVTVIDGATNTVLTNVNLAGLNGANGVALNRAANLVYVTTFGSDSLAVIDGATNGVVTTVPAGDQPNGIKYDATTNRIYVANFGVPDSLTILNAAGYAVVATVNLKAGPPWDYDAQGVAVNVFANKVYVANARTVYPNAVVSVVNLVSNLVEEEVTIGVIAREADANPVTRLAYVANYGSDTVSVLSDPSLCCDQSAAVSEIPGPPQDRTVSVSGAGRFRLDWKALAGGSPVTLFDLTEDPLETLDLAGGEPGWSNYPGLFYDGIWYESFAAPAAPTAWWSSTFGDGVTPDAKLELLEATPTRVKLRQESFYHHTLTQGITARIPGLKGIGDYSIYGVGRLALKWRRQASTAVTWGGGATATGSADLNWVVRKDSGVPALNAWTAYRPAGALAPNTTGGPGSGADDFLLMKSDYTATSPNVKTDLLVTPYSDWADAQVSAHNDASASDKAAWLAWEDNRAGAAGPHIRSWTAGQGETFNFLTSWKPTNLGLGASPWLDGAVVTRASDYRTPATITLSQGSRWADADENTPTGSPMDFYNESEAAYLFDLHQVQGVSFTMSASLAQPRYTPFLKVRQWRWLQDPQAVTLGSVRLTNDVDFKADLKPVARAHKTGALSWHCTLQDAPSCSPPDVGSGGGAVVGGSSFVPARYGNGLAVTTNDAYVFAPPADFHFGVGAIEFWYRPNYDSTSAGPHLLFNNTGFGSGTYDCFWLEHVGGNLVLRAYSGASNQSCNIGGSAVFSITATGTDYHWRAGEWVHLRAEWSSGSYMRLLVDGRVVGSFGTYGVVGWDVGQTRIGSCQVTCPGGGGSRNADGIIDEPHLYFGMGAPGNPETLAYGGLAGDSREWLGTVAQNATLLTNAVGSGSKGEYLYLGADSRFRGLNMSFVTPGGGVAPGALVWQYWRDDGAGSEGWADLESVTGFSDGTADFSQNGAVKWDADPAEWKPYSVNGGPDLFYVRVHLSGWPTNFSPSPVESLVKTDILLFQYCGDLTANSFFSIPSPAATTEVTLSTFTAAAGDASVRLEWGTASELRNLGFHVYRGPSADGPWQRLTATLVPGLGSSAVGRSYAFTDAGLRNGTRYYYRLEDVDDSGKATSHGPVSAVPTARAAAGDEQPDGERDGPATEGDGGSSCPAWVLAAYGQAAGEEDAALARARCTRHGDPEATSLRVLSRSSRQATLELATGGFYALHEPAGSVRVFVPGFDFPEDEEAAALPVRRALVDAVVGRRVELGGVRALELEGFGGLVPSELGRSEMRVAEDGTVRAGRRRPRALAERRGASRSRGLARSFAASELVRLLPSQFQGETKSAALELAPLRFDARRQQLVLARRVRVKLLFTGREAGESGRGSVGRAPQVPKPGASGALLAVLHAAQPGLHAVAFETLFPARKRGLPASELRLERQGEAVAFHVEPGGDFGPGSRLFFHADRGPASTDYAGEVAYELLRSSAGLRMPVAAAPPGSTEAATEPVVRREFETNRYYLPGLLQAPDPWLWEAVGSGATRVASFTLGPLSASGGAQLEVQLQGGSESGQAVDHHVSLSVNGTLVGEAQFAGKKPYRASLGLSASLLREGPNELQLTSVPDTGAASLVFLDRFTLAHPQPARATGGRFEGTWQESGSVSVSGLTSAPALVELSAPPAPGAAGVRWLHGHAAAGGALGFRAEAGRTYLVVSQPLAPRVERPEPSTLRAKTNQADWLLIAPRAFLAAAEPLVARRKDQGLAARAVSFEEITAQFGHGQPSAEAIRGFLGHAFQSWRRPSPRYVVLLGDASYDPRNFTGVSVPSPLPALWTKTSYLWTVSDPLLAAVNGADPVPDLAIGRLPATSEEQARTLVEKLLAWEDSGQGLAGAAVLVADDPDGAGDFVADAHDVASTYLTGRASVLSLSEHGAGLRPRIQAALDGGLSYLSYVGHGGAAVWASENVWNSWDAASLRAQSTQPLLVTLNCLNGYFVAPSFESLAESLVKAQGRGAIASVSPSGLSLDGPAHQYHRALMAELTGGGHARLGDALVAAQRTYAATGLMPELLAVYHLLGDPATPIR